MRSTLSAGILGMLLATAVSAAEVHGTISENGKPLPQGLLVKLECLGGVAASAATDSFGGYSLKTAASGDCKITVDYKGGLSLPVAVYDKPSRYDLIVKTDGGKTILARK
ncbi:MAG TPA: hypothetical protein VGM80_08750 [Gaiellaceae bacterium]